VLKGKFCQLISLVAIFVLCSVVVKTGRAQSASVPTPKKAEEQFKNIKVLKGVPADQLIPTMQFITASLGVECDFCHVQNAFDKDDKKPKQTARKMMDMMFAINKDNFQGQREVTCYSCHRGNAKPVSIPAVMMADSKVNAAESHTGEEEAGKTGSVPSPEQLLDKYVQASGGPSAIEKITSRVMTGTIEFGGKALPIEIYSKDGKRISFTHMPEGDSVTAFNGREGWLGMSGHAPREMHGSDLEGAAIDADLHLPMHLNRMFTGMKVEGAQKVGDHDTYEVVGQHEGKLPLQMYFDQQSGLLVRMVRYGDTALGVLPTQIDYADYRNADGVQVPFRWTLARPSGRFTIQIADLKQNVPVDETRFVKPPAPPEVTKPAK
jgi:photosynthetic reaction center cytochrome c subunit